ncbi:hypothetical protein HZA75_03065 [Candidatus Roizmanbacteria bacterium]|nr:hypothetical protein [Candidatus Roizmanbacteria bacterium]
MLSIREEELTISEIIKITSHAEYKSLRGFLLEVLTESRRSDITNVEFFQLQGKIIEKIIPLEKKISFFKKTADPKIRNQAWYTRELYKAQWRAIKQVMDGIAWRMLKFDRIALRQIAEHNPTGHLSEGILEEVQKGGEIVNSSDHFVIFNDLTNFLRHGDLTIFTPNEILIDEVKTKGKATKAQSESLDKLLNRLNKRVYKIGDVEAGFIEIKGSPSNFLKEVESIIIKAMTNHERIFAQRVSPYLWVSCIYIPTIEQNIKSGISPKLPSSPFPGAESLPPIGNFTLFDSFSPNLAPYSIFPFAENIIVGLMTGEIQLKAVISRKELVKSAKGKGWELTFPAREVISKMYDKAKTRNECREVSRSVENYVTFKKGAFEYKMGKEILYRIDSEFLSIKALLASAEQVRTMTGSGVSRTFTTNFSEEHEMWR